MWALTPSRLRLYQMNSLAAARTALAEQVRLHGGNNGSAPRGGGMT